VARAATAPERFDAVVVGAGFGGLGAGLELAEQGLSTCVLEALVYPGGCASTFTRDGYRFESGATLFSGFGAGQWFERLIARHRIDVGIEWLDPVIELRTDRLRLAVPRDGAEWQQRLCALPGAPVEAVRRFLERQQRVADALWPLLDDPDLVAPFGLRALAHHARRLHRYPPLASTIGRTLADVARRDGVWGFEPLRVVLDALCQITIQTCASEAEAPFALATLDYPFRGTAHVRGGIGELAHGLAAAVASAGPDGSGVRYAQRARAVERVEVGGTRLWRVRTSRGEVEAPRLVLNLLPQDAARLLDAGGVERRIGRARLERDERRVTQGGWGACMLYLVVDEPEGAPAKPQHLELVQDPGAPFVEGNHLFMSISGRDESGEGAVGRGGPRAPAGKRTVTVSTHVPLERYLGLDEQGPGGDAARSDRAQYVAEIQQRMAHGIECLAPQWHAGIVHQLPASPRTFARFTGRSDGYVGGVPRRRGLAHYVNMGPRVLGPGLVLVGDSTFPGQSTLATALGGAAAARRVL
jgi:phytoene dehydrogenase-like protein